MGLTITAAAATAAGTGQAEWSVNTLKAQVLGELMQDRNVESGAPDRLKNIVIQSLRAVWGAADWIFTLRETSLAATAADTEETLATDFGEMHSWVVKDVDHSAVMQFTTDARRWRERKSNIDTSATGHPEIGLIKRDTSDTDDFIWKVYFEIACDQDYTWPYFYKALCPIDLPAAHADLKGEDDIIPMPLFMHELWHLDATWRAEKAFREDDSWKASKKLYDDRVDAAKVESDDPATLSSRTIQDGYQDWDSLPTTDTVPYIGSDASRLPGL